MKFGETVMEDTIAAIATPPGEGGIGIIRISGERAKEVMDRVFVPANGKPVESRRMTYGTVVDPEDGRKIDEVLCVYMKGPKTYNGFQRDSPVKRTGRR